MDKDECIKLVAGKIGCSEKESGKIVDKAIAGREIKKEDPNFHEWYYSRLLPNLVSIDFDTYSKTAIDALKILPTVAATDFGTSRQRDFGQLWADLTRGYLAESAFQQYLEQNGVESILAHERGELKDHLPSDIPFVKTIDDEDFREAGINIGIKGTKWNGIWLDIPGDQFSHSDYHVLVKVGVHRDHLFGYFGQLGVFRNIISEAKRLNLLDSDEDEETLVGYIPKFEPITAYICGFIQNKGQAMTVQANGADIFDGKLARMHYTIHTWKGEYKGGDLEEVARLAGVTHPKGKAKFTGLDFSPTKHTIFNTGSLNWKASEWKLIIEQL